MEEDQPIALLNDIISERWLYLYCELENPTVLAFIERQLSSLELLVAQIIKHSSIDNEKLIYISIRSLSIYFHDTIREMFLAYPHTGLPEEVQRGFIRTKAQLETFIMAQMVYNLRSALLSTEDHLTEAISHYWPEILARYGPLPFGDSIIE